MSTESIIKLGMGTAMGLATLKLVDKHLSKQARLNRIPKSRVKIRMI